MKTTFDELVEATVDLELGDDVYKAKTDIDHTMHDILIEFGNVIKEVKDGVEGDVGGIKEGTYSVEENVLKNEIKKDNHVEEGKKEGLEGEKRHKNGLEGDKEGLKEGT